MSDIAVLWVKTEEFKAYCAYLYSSPELKPHPMNSYLPNSTEINYVSLYGGGHLAIL